MLTLIIITKNSQKNPNKQIWENKQNIFNWFKKGFPQDI